MDIGKFTIYDVGTTVSLGKFHFHAIWHNSMGYDPQLHIHSICKTNDIFHHYFGLEEAESKKQKPKQKYMF